MSTWIVRYTAGEWTVARAFRTPTDAYKFAEHIERVWNADLQGDVEYRRYN